MSASLVSGRREVAKTCSVRGSSSSARVSAAPMPREAPWMSAVMGRSKWAVEQRHGDVESVREIT